MPKLKPCSSDSFHLAEMPGDQDGTRCNLHSQPWVPWPRADNTVETVSVSVTAKVCTSCDGGRGLLDGSYLELFPQTSKPVIMLYICTVLYGFQSIFKDVETG